MSEKRKFNNVLFALSLMEITREFRKLSRGDVAIAGGKGASLGEMLNNGIPVPDGFVVLSSAFEQFIKEAGLNVEIDAILDTVRHEEVHTVEEASEKIQALILSKEMPEDIEKEILSSFKKLNSEFAAVRSSATSEDSASAAWAGQLDSFLNTTKENLLENAKKCWASLFTPRAIFYRFEKDLHKEKISVAVVVQKMVNSEKSGIAFSVHPVTQDYNQIIIEAGFGLGEAIVSGQITPDSYVVDKRDWKIINVNVNSQARGLFRKSGGGNEWRELGSRGEEQVLNEKEIVELSKLIVKIEEHYGFPVDVEWAREGDDSRIGKKGVSGKRICGKFYIVQSRPITTLGKKEEKIPALIDFKKGDWIVYGASGFPAFVTPFAVVPSREFIEKFGITNEVIVLWKGKTFDWLYNGDQLCELAEKVLPRLLKEKWRYYEEWKMIADKFDQFHYELIDKDLAKLNDKKLINLAKEYYKLFKKQFSSNNLIEPLSFYFQKNLKDLLTKTGLSEEEVSKLEKLYGSPAKKNYVKKCIGEYNKLEDKNNVAKLLKKYHYMNNDYRGIGSFSKKDLIDLASQNELSNEIILPKAGNSKAQDLLEVLQIASTIQDVRKAESLMWVSGADLLLKEFSRRKNVPYEDLRYATWDEIISGDISTDDLQKRKEKCVVYWLSTGIQIFIGEESDKVFDSYKKEIIKESGEVKEIKGVSASGGKINGTVKVVLNVSQFNKIKKGDILVTMMTRPEYLPVMKLAAAFVTDEGGITSHAAIISRELNKPCVIGTRIATKVLKDGMEVEVDADNGIVKILQRAEDESGQIVTLTKSVNKNPKVFTLFTTRNFPILFIESYYDMIDELEKDFGYKTYPIFVFYRENNTVQDYFNPDELKEEFINMKRTMEDDEKLNSMINEFNKNFNKLLPYFDGKNVNSKKDLKEVYNVFVRYFVGFAYTWVLPDLKDISDEVRERCLQIRRKTESYSSKRDKLFERLLQNLLPSLKDKAQFLSKEEAFSNIPEEELIETADKRSQGYIIHNRKIIVASEIEKYLRDQNIKLEKPSSFDSKTNSLSGTAAYKGVVTGKARVIYSDKDLVKIKDKNDILVTPMTRPDYVPYMRRAGAIVTDEGGLICHAAIVARELKVPCIVGTKFATSMIKTGDLVEVDANKGVVKIIKKKMS